MKDRLFSIWVEDTQDGKLELTLDTGAAIYKYPEITNEAINTLIEMRFQYPFITTENIKRKV